MIHQDHFFYSMQTDGNIQLPHNFTQFQPPAGPANAVVLFFAQIPAGPILHCFLDPKVDAGDDEGGTSVHNSIFRKTRNTRSTGESETQKVRESEIRYSDTLII